MVKKLIFRELRETAPTECLMAILYAALSLLCLLPTRWATYDYPWNAFFFGDGSDYPLLVYPNLLFRIFTCGYLLAVIIWSARSFYRDLFGRGVLPEPGVPVSVGSRIAIKACIAALWIAVAVTAVALCSGTAPLLGLRLVRFISSPSPLQIPAILFPRMLLLLAILYFWAVTWPVWRRERRRLRAGFLLAALCLGAVLAVILLSALFQQLWTEEFARRMIHAVLCLAAAIVFFILTRIRMARVLVF